MTHFKNINLAAYVYAYTLRDCDDAALQKMIDTFQEHIELTKVYLENHRGTTDISPERMKEVKALFEKNGIKTSGGITSTQLVGGVRKPAFYDTFCYTDPAHRAEYLRIVRELASVFDEIILDDFFFTSCRCEMCIAAKGKRSWAQYRLDLMEEFSHRIVDEAKRINPKMNFIIKYPNWYESYQETGYNPGKQKDIFDMIYTGTETRNPFFDPQHLQRYESYSLMRLLENTAPGRNGGGWIDQGGSGDNMNRYLEQAALTFYGKARELMLFNLQAVYDSDHLAALSHSLRRVDERFAKLGEPVGVSAWEPYDGDGEDQLYNYLGMCGAPIEPTPEFTPDAPAVLFTESTAHDPSSCEKLEEYVRNGGTAIVTVGYFRAVYDLGIREMTSVRLTGRHVLGKDFLIDLSNYTGSSVCSADKDLLFEILNYKTNATVSDISLCVEEDNFPVMTEDNYGKGRLFILNVPENYADLYHLPAGVIGTMNKYLSLGQKLYLEAAPKYILLSYDNNVYGLLSFRPHRDTVRIMVRGESKALRGLDTKKAVTESLPLPEPNFRGDATSTIPELPERAYEVALSPGEEFFFTVE